MLLVPLSLPLRSSCRKEILGRYCRAVACADGPFAGLFSAGHGDMFPASTRILTTLTKVQGRPHSYPILRFVEKHFELQYCRALFTAEFTPQKGNGAHTCALLLIAMRCDVIESR
jgi:hypothetical protein